MGATDRRGDATFERGEVGLPKRCSRGAGGMETALPGAKAARSCSNRPRRDPRCGMRLFEDSCSYRSMAPPRDSGPRTQPMNRSLAGLGHREGTWRNWPGFGTLAVIAPEILVPEGYRAVIVAPRADDDTLG